MAHSAFELVRTQNIPSLNVEAQEYRHTKTGAIHYHLASELDENVFLVAFRTVPEDSTGVAHILEHTALCGSEKYPVRDPFFMMIRRSLNTFMNAFTSSDWTAYPFASENRKDYFNLLDVYLDAAFFSRLDEMDFRQEGHRLEFHDPADANSGLEFKGVVFNEMKGAMSSPVQRLWQSFTSHLFEHSTYHYNSGGEPENIVDLTYDELKEFYRTHYHPSNAIFMTFGNISVDEIQQRVEDQALSRFDKLDEKLEVTPEPRWSAPKVVTEPYPAEEGKTENKTHVVMGWLLGDSTDLEKQLEAQLVSSLLLDNSASPLRKALEQTDLGMAPSPLCGLEDSNREMAFVCGLEGSQPEKADEIEQLIQSTLQQVAEQGVDQQQVEAVLHQIELSQREIGGDHYPYGLQLILSALSTAVHRGDAFSQLDIDQAVEALREKIKDTNYIPRLVKELLLDNPHRVRLSMVPDTGMAQRMDDLEKSRLKEIEQNLDQNQKDQLVELALKLKDRQEQHDDPEVLPKVTREDIPDDISTVEPDSQTEDYRTHFTAGTNGITYLQTIVELPELNQEELALIPLYSNLLTELGTGDKDFLEVQQLQSRYTGGLSSWMGYKADLNDVQKVSGHFVLSGKSLDRNEQRLENLMLETLQNVRFDEQDRIYDLISQIRVRREQSVTGSGHSLAMTAASANWSAGMSLAHTTGGMNAIQRIKELHDGLKEPEGAEKLAHQLQALHQKLLDSQKQVLTISDKPVQLTGNWKELSQGSDAHLINSQPLEDPSVAWVTNTQVNFCAKAFPTVAPSHQDSAALTVLAGVLRNGFLHRAIREQGGAYGGGASHDPTNGVFRFYSYRDPRFIETLNDFDKSVEWLMSKPLDERALEESVLGVIGSMDKPGSPAGEAKQEFYNRLYGRTPEQRRHYRNSILAVTLDDLYRVADQYLRGKTHATAVGAHIGQAEQMKQAGLRTEEL
jgi:Zn-dependent M16 (insulinase) family peptidase